MVREWKVIYLSERQVHLKRGTDGGSLFVPVNWFTENGQVFLEHLCWIFIIVLINCFILGKIGDPEGTVMEQDLKLCSVRPLNDTDRRYCFEVISPTKFVKR